MNNKWQETQSTVVITDRNEKSWPIQANKNCGKVKDEFEAPHKKKTVIIQSSNNKKLIHFTKSITFKMLMTKKWNDSLEKRVPDLFLEHLCFFLIIHGINYLQIFIIPLQINQSNYYCWPWINTN